MKYSFACFILISLFSCKTQQLVLSEGEMYSELHSQNTGKITFMNEVIPIDEYSQADFRDNVTHNEAVDLSFRMFLDKTLTYYLHELAPELEVNDLCKKGNFALTIFLDGKEVYTENLNSGAGSCWYKNSATIYRVPLISVEQADHWGRYMWARFLYQNGGAELLAGSPARLRLEVRPYLSLEETIRGDVIASGEVTLDPVSLSEQDVTLEDIQEIAPGSGWEISEASYDTRLIKELNGAIATKKYKEITSIVVLKEGQLLLEEYFNGSDRMEKHNTRSVGKSFMSAVMGIAIDEGNIKSEDEKLASFYDLAKYKNYSVAKDNVSLKDMLTMSSGFNGDDGNMDSPGNEEYMYPTKNWVKFGLDLSMRDDQKWTYFTAGSVILGDVIEKTVPGGLEAFADSKLLGPLGITNYQWQYTPQNVANTAGGIQMNALDFAKFGQLYKNGGSWKGQQIISEDWVRKSFSKQAIINKDRGDYYGYQFWEKTFTIDGHEYGVNYCTGTGGNKIYIFKELPLVIVITTKAFRLPNAHHQVKEMMEKYILPAMI